MTKRLPPVGFKNTRFEGASAVIDFVDKIFQAIEQGKFFVGIFLDFWYN